MCLPDGKCARAFGDCGIGTWQMAINRTNSASGKLTLPRILEGFCIGGGSGGSRFILK